MDASPRNDQSNRDYEEIPSIDPLVADFNSSTNPQTIRDFQTNGSVGKNSSSTPTQRPHHSSHYEPYSQQDPYLIAQNDYENDQRRSPLSPVRRQTNPPNNSGNDEFQLARNRNGSARRPFRHSGESEEYESVLNRDPTTQTFVTTPPVNLNSASSMPISTYNIQFEERERRMQDENDALKKENAALKSRLNETADELRHTNEEYQAELSNKEERQGKAERVIKRMKADYDARIANLQEEQNQIVATHESYRHEQEQTNSNVNIEEYLRKIDQQDRLIKQLNDRLNLQKPLAVRLPLTINPQTTDENLRRLNEYAETIDQLRAECDELRRSENNLRRQIEDLNRLFEPSNGRLPPRLSIIDEVQQVEDPQSAIAQLSLQLQNDAENVSGLTNRIAQIIRDREDNQNKLKEKDAQIRQYETREAEFESRTVQKFDRQIEGLQRDMRILEKQVEASERRVEELMNENAQLRAQLEHDQQEVESNYSRIADEQINDLQQKLDNKHQQYDTIRREYEKMVRMNENKSKTTFDSSDVESLKETIQRQEKQLEDSKTQLQVLENKLEQQRNHLERERDVEKGKVDQTQNELGSYKRRYNELENQYEKLRPLLDDQQNKHEKQVQNYQTRLADLEQERDDLNEKVEALEYEKETFTPENDPKFLELNHLNHQLREQISRYEVRFHDSEDEAKRHQNELNTLQDDYQTTIQQFDEFKVTHARAQNDLTTTTIEKDEIQTENQTLNEENNKLKHELDELEIRIRLEINQEYENTYRDRYNELTERKDGEIENVLQEKETTEFELERVTNERARFENQLHEIENELQNANETIQNYERDIQRLREDLNKSKENNQQIERQLSQTYSEKFKDQNDQIQDLTQQLRSSQITQSDEQYSPPYNQSNNYSERSNFDDNERYVLRSNAPNNQELINQLENKLREQDDIIHSLQSSHVIGDDEPIEIELALQIRIQDLEREIETKERSIQQYTETAQVKDEYIEKLLQNYEEGDTNTVETLKEELENRSRRFDQTLNDRNFKIEQCERQIGELQFNVKDRERKLAETTESLGEAEEKIDELQLQIDDLTRQKNRLTLIPEDRETYLAQIRELEKELEMQKKINTSTPPEQRDLYEKVLEDLKSRLRQSDDSVQHYKQYPIPDDNMKRSLNASDEQVRDTRQAQHRMAGDLNRANLHSDQLTSDVENRDQMITSLREKLAEKDQEINKLHENNLAKEQKLNELYAKLIDVDPEMRRTPSGSERAPSNVQLRVELQKKEQEINDLKQRLDEAQQDKPDQTDSSIASSIPKEPCLRPRSNFGHLRHEELLFELDMALQHNQDLNDRLKQKFPTITELHNQLVGVRDELSRQKYVNQVLWRKLNVLIDIHGSNTRNELAIELANYQDELAKLKSLQSRMNDARSAIGNANSRSSSEQNLSTLYHGLSAKGHDFPSKNIKSTIALLERSNIEWQAKLARLTEQLGRSESQSRNYHREMIKYQKLLADAGLTDSVVRQRRRSADDSLISGLHDSNVISDDLTELDNIDELKEIIRNQRKYNQQLQMRIRLNTPDLIQSPVIEKLQEEIHNLNLVIETYKNESKLLKNELKKLYKTIEHDRKTSQQYEQLFKDQQLSIEQSKKKLTKYDQLLRNYDNHQPIYDDTKDYIIDLDIDIIRDDDRKKKTSVGKKDSGFSNATDGTEQRKQLREKDEEIRHLNDQLQEKDDRIEQLTNELNNRQIRDENIQHENHNDFDRDLSNELHDTQKELQEARLQLDTLKTSRSEYEPAEEQNQELRAEIKHLQNEIERNKPLLEHYKTQIDILEKRTPSARDHDASEMPIQSSEFSQLLEEMRLLRRDLERSLQKQNELQAKLDENIRQSQSPREFTFSGRGVSYPDLRLLDTSGFIAPENLSLSSPRNCKHSKPVISSSTEYDSNEYPREIERTITTKAYIVGELRTHNDLRRLVEDIKFDLKTVGQELKDKLRSRTSSSITDTFTRSLEERLIALDERLTRALDVIETYWRADLPEKNRDDEHVFIDQRLLDENKHLLAAQRKYIRDAQMLREKYVEQSKHLDQLLTQLTKVNRKKADTGDYLALLLRPTLDVLQKARSNIENHLKETNTNHIPPGSAQSHRRHRSRRQE